jgi:hypothetical protein
MVIHPSCYLQQHKFIFVFILANKKGYAERIYEGRSADVYPTEEGKKFKVIIVQALKFCTMLTAIN